MSPDPSASVMFCNASVYSTVDPFASAVQISGDTVAWLGSDEAARALTAEDTAVRDVHGAVITPAFVAHLFPEAAELPIEVYPLPNLGGVNVVIHGLLGAGVAASTRFDPQAKGLGEWLRSRHVDIPLDLLPADSVAQDPSGQVAG